MTDLVYAVRFKFTPPTLDPDTWHFWGRLPTPDFEAALEMYTDLLPRVGKWYSELELVERPVDPEWSVVRNRVAGQPVATEYVVDARGTEWLLRANTKIVDRAPMTREGHDDLIKRNGLAGYFGAMLFENEEMK